MEAACTKGPWGVYKLSVTLRDGTETVFESEALLNATGRVPNVCGMGLEAVGVDYDNRRGVHVDECFVTTNPNVYACGDCASPFKFTHAADWQVREPGRESINQSGRQAGRQGIRLAGCYRQTDRQTDR